METEACFESSEVIEDCENRWFSPDDVDDLDIELALGEESEPEDEEDYDDAAHLCSAAGPFLFPSRRNPVWRYCGLLEHHCTR
ncbi:hypothetical protein [Nesterenkonia ebinurensis]|uniref:hypothetical protein n=1 Tax=Nesterenkonia ebinurensis TaxID=2608252 RepID=UPI001CC78B26|nr:hypothetical protein [Nesterenkonia ebinurensis]